MSEKKLFFSLEGVDVNDDASLQAFAERVWEHVTAAWQQEGQHQQEDMNTTGEPHE